MLNWILIRASQIVCHVDCGMSCEISLLFKRLARPTALVFLKGVSSDGTSNYQNKHPNSRIGCTKMASLQYVSSCGGVSCQNRSIHRHIGCTWMAFPQCESSYALSIDQRLCKHSCTCHTYVVFLGYAETSCAFLSDWLCGRKNRKLCTCEVFLQSGFVCAISEHLRRLSNSHMHCNDVVFLQYVSKYVFLRASQNDWSNYTASESTYIASPLYVWASAASSRHCGWKTYYTVHTHSPWLPAYLIFVTDTTDMSV